MMTDEITTTATDDKKVEATEPSNVEAAVLTADAPTNQPPAELLADPAPTTEATAQADAPAAHAPEAHADAPAAPEATAPQPTPTPSPEPKNEAPAKSDEDLFAAAMAELDNSGSTGAEQSYRKLNKGDRIEAKVIQVEPDKVFVDLGTKSEGVIPLAELSVDPIETAVGVVNIGDTIQVIVLRPEGQGGDGNPVVSKRKADFAQVWYSVLDKFNSGELVHATVVNRVKGGLEVDLGVRGFVPATHVGNGKLRNIDKFVGQTLELKIIEVDKDRQKVVLSNRIAEDEKRETVKADLFTKVKPGDTLEGTVRRLTDYGAFVDLGGIDGLLHISEMSWMRINHPKEVIKEGQKLNVMVLRLDEGTGKISLGLRQVLPDPWNLIKTNYRIGQKIPCIINRLVQSGAFIRLPEGAEAFLPVSEISNRRIGKPSDVLTEGQEVEVAIIDLRPDERRMVLSMRAAGTAIDPPGAPEASGPPGDIQYHDEDRRGMRGLGGKSAGGGKSRGGKGRPGGGGRGRGGDDDDFEGGIIGRVPTGGATIGERLGMLKGLNLAMDDAEEDLPATTEAEKDSDES